MQKSIFINFSYLLIIGAVLFSCTSGSDKIEKQIAAIPVSFDVVRFDLLFGNAKPQDLPQLKKHYPAFFPKKYPDSIWINRMNDTLQHKMITEVDNVFSDDKIIKTQLEPLFQHIKYYFPQFREPNVYTVLSDVDYKNKVFASDTLLVIGIDNYLGVNHEFYRGLPLYVSQNLSPTQLQVDVASVYAKKFIAKPKSNTFLDKIIFYGKELYLKQIWLPKISEAQIIGYTPEQMQWVKENETEMWRYFVEKELLFSTDPKLDTRFIKPAPFSKFYLEIDNESPGRVGIYLGWQIVKRFMKKNPTTNLKQLMLLDAKQIFEKSKYKPKK